MLHKGTREGRRAYCMPHWAGPDARSGDVVPRAALRLGPGAPAIPRMRVLVAGFNAGGYDQFFATHYSAERRPLKKGDVVASSFRLVMSANGK